MIFISIHFYLTRSLLFSRSLSPSLSVSRMCSFSASLSLVMNMNSSSVRATLSVRHGICLALFLLFRPVYRHLLLFVVCFTWIYHFNIFLARTKCFCCFFVQYNGYTIAVIVNRTLFIFSCYPIARFI